MAIGQMSDEKIRLKGTGQRPKIEVKSQRSEVKGQKQRLEVRGLQVKGQK